MANRIEQARAAVDACIREAYLRAVAAGELPEGCLLYTSDAADEL